MVNGQASSGKNLTSSGKHLKIHDSIASLRKSPLTGTDVIFLKASGVFKVGIGTHLLTLLRAVMLATMMLSGLGEATALNVPFQNFSKSSFSSSCDPRDREGRQGGGWSGHGGCICGPKTLGFMETRAGELVPPLFRY